MKIFLIVHGVVQGVGYRHLVNRAAARNGIKGMVRNASNGSVEILADADSEKLSTFEKEINVSLPYGPRVFNIERYMEDSSDFPKETEEYEDFVIER